MAIKIKLPYSSTASALPTAGSLITGEMVVNVTDQKIYVKDTASVKQLIGSQGSQGFQGTNTGASVTGPQGTQGSQGTQGPQGTQGSQGLLGPQGTQGSQGSLGFQGNAGLQGTQGLTGTKGPQGNIGYAGNAGFTGPQGAQGPQGVQGYQGLNWSQVCQTLQTYQQQQAVGPQGRQGATGPQGFQGAAGTYSPGPSVATTCFLGSSYTVMADGSRKMMRDIKVGDWLMGAFGEANQVLALEDLTLGNRPMFVINYIHHTTGDHPHVTPDRKFVAIEPDEAFKEWGQWYNCELADGSFVMLKNVGFDNPEDKVKEMKLNDSLHTIEGSKIVESIESYSLPYDTKLYNFVMSGSHTYSVDGYFVTGWPRDDDFDYVNWKHISGKSKIEDWIESNGN